MHFKMSYVATTLLQNYGKPKAKIGNIYNLRQVTKAPLTNRDDYLESYCNIWKGSMRLNLKDNVNFNFSIKC